MENPFIRTTRIVDCRWSMVDFRSNIRFPIDHRISNIDNRIFSHLSYNQHIKKYFRLDRVFFSFFRINN